MIFPGKCVCSFNLTVIAYVTNVVIAKNYLAWLPATGPLFSLPLTYNKYLLLSIERDCIGKQYEK